MSDKIISLTERLNKRAEDAERAVALPQYELPNTSILMDPLLQLTTLQESAFNRFSENDLSAAVYYQLFGVLKFIVTGVVTSFDIKWRSVGREYPHKSKIYQKSVYLWAGSMNRILEAKEAGDDSLYPDLQIEVGYYDFTDGDEVFVIDKGVIYPDERMVFTIPESGIPVRNVRHIVRQMNALVRNNGGFGSVGEKGYSVVLPYSGQTGMVISLVLENEITMLSNEE